MGAEEVPSSAFLCRSRQFAEARFSVLARSSWFLLSFVLRTFSSQETATSSSASGNSISRVLYVGGHQEDFGTFGSDSPASPFLTSLASKSAKGTMSSPTLAFSRAFT
jgi:hypothetical protein